MQKAILKNKTFTINTQSKVHTIDGVEFSADIIKTGNKSFHVIKENKSYSIEILSENQEEKKTVVRINGKKAEVSLSSEMDELLKSMGISSTSEKKIKNVKAPMPGLISKILIQVGEEIEKGGSLLILEAMKMENILKSPTKGIVKEIKCKAGTAIEKNEILIVFAD